MTKLWIVPNDLSLSREGAEVFVHCAREAVEQRGIFSVMLSGGNTPKKMFQLLATPEFRDQVAWKNTNVFWADERMVPSDSPESNFRLAWENWLQFVPIPSRQIHRIHTELIYAKRVAEVYEQELRTLNHRFDLIYLGIGEDAHTASLFPNISTPGYDQQSHSKWVIAPWVPHLSSYRISVTPELINLGRQIVFLVLGEKKARALKNVLEGPYDPKQYPAQRVQPKDEKVLWIVDEQAANQLKSQTKKISQGKVA